MELLLFDSIIHTASIHLSSLPLNSACNYIFWRLIALSPLTLHFMHGYDRIRYQIPDRIMIREGCGRGASDIGGRKSSGDPD